MTLPKGVRAAQALGIVCRAPLGGQGSAPIHGRSNQGHGDEIGTAYRIPNDES
jgi:hypothetical protein